MMNRDGYPVAWVRERAIWAMAPIRHPGPVPAHPIQPRKLEARYGPATTGPKRLLKAPEQ